MPVAKKARFKVKPSGRPSAYDPSYDDMVYRLALARLDDRAIADVLGISVATLNNWKIGHKTFLEALNRGKAPADADMATSLYRQGNGHFQRVEKVYIVNGKPKVVKYNEYFPPSAAASIFWMKNRQRDLWRDVQRTENEHTGKDGGPIKSESQATVILDASKLAPDARENLREALKAAKG